MVLHRLIGTRRQDSVIYFTCFLIYDVETRQCPMHIVVTQWTTRRDLDQDSTDIVIGMMVSD
jgi:hypothetical protein